MTTPPSPRVPIEGAVAELWASTDAVGFLRGWVSGQVPTGEHTEHTGNRLVEVPRPGQVVMVWTPGPRLVNLSGGVHGGYLMVVCDEAAGLAATSLGERFVPMLTLDLDVSFLRPARLGAEHRVEAEVVHAGRARNVVDARVLGPDGKLVATARGSFLPNLSFVEQVVGSDAGARRAGPA